MVLFRVVRAEVVSASLRVCVRVSECAEEWGRFWLPSSRGAGARTRATAADAPFFRALFPPRSPTANPAAAPTVRAKARDSILRTGGAHKTPNTTLALGQRRVEVTPDFFKKRRALGRERYKG
jgi:hypothetical protein